MEILKRLLFEIILSVLILSFPVAGISKVSIQEQKKLWTDLVDLYRGSGENRFQEWNLIEEITLIKRVKDVSPKAAALATIIEYYNKDDKFFMGDDEIVESLKEKAEERKLREDELLRVREAHIRHRIELKKEYDDAMKEHKTFFTKGVNISRVMKKYLKENRDDVIKAISNFALKRAYEVPITKRDNFEFQELKESINQKVPFIMMPIGGKNFFVCIGYIEKRGKKYLIVADPDRIRFKEVSHASFVLGEGEKAKRAREKSKALDKKFGLAKLDWKFSVTDEVAQGIEIVNWGKGKFTIYVVDDFKVAEEIVDQKFFGN
jgi:hypothetical protein